MGSQIYIINQDRTKLVTLDTIEITNIFTREDDQSTYEDPNHAKIIVNKEEFGFGTTDLVHRVFTKILESIANWCCLIDLSILLNE